MTIRAAAVIGVTLVSLLPASALATTVDWGVHGTLELAAILAAPGPIDDTILFSKPDLGDISSTTVANNLLTLTNLEGGIVSLYQETGSTDTLIGSYSFDGTTGSTAHSFLLLPAGTYYYSISGNALGSQGAFYSITSTHTAPIPEPATALMFLGGAASLCLVARRRGYRIVAQR